MEWYDVPLDSGFLTYLFLFYNFAHVLVALPNPILKQSIKKTILDIHKNLSNVLLYSKHMPSHLIFIIMSSDIYNFYPHLKMTKLRLRDVKYLVQAKR